MESDFLTQQDCDQLASDMMKKYRIALKGRTFTISARVEGAGVYVNVLFSSADRSYYYPVDARVMFAAEEMTESEAALFLIDYIDIYFQEYLLEEDEALLLPIDWQDYEYEAINFQLKGQILNRKLEVMADALLGESYDAPM